MGSGLGGVFAGAGGGDDLAAPGLAALRDDEGGATFLTGNDLAVAFRPAADFVFGAAGFTFFRGDALFFCLVSLAMQSYPVLRPRAREGTDPASIKGRIGQDKVTEGFLNGKHRTSQPMPLILRGLLEQLIQLARGNPVLLSQEFDRLATRAHRIIGHFAKFVEEYRQLWDRSLVLFGQFGSRHDDSELPSRLCK